MTAAYVFPLNSKFTNPAAPRQSHVTVQQLQTLNSFSPSFPKNLSATLPTASLIRGKLSSPLREAAMPGRKKIAGGGGELQYRLHTAPGLPAVSSTFPTGEEPGRTPRSSRLGRRTAITKQKHTSHSACHVTHSCNLWVTLRSLSAGLTVWPRSRELRA